jgi:hypothetical protein
MPRRGGKAASRRSRQRPPRRPIIPGPSPAPASRPAPTSVADAPPSSRAPTGAEARTAPVSPALAGVSSRLGERARLEYHYVGRDLRNIAVLTAIIAVLLIGSWLVLPATGLVSR